MFREPVLILLVIEDRGKLKATYHINTESLTYGLRRWTISRYVTPTSLDEFSQFSSFFPFRQRYWKVWSIAS